MVEEVLIEKVDDSNVCLLANATVNSSALDLQEHCVCYIVNATKVSKALPNNNKIHYEIKALVCDQLMTPSFTS